MARHALHCTCAAVSENLQPLISCAYFSVDRPGGDRDDCHHDDDDDRDDDDADDDGDAVGRVEVGERGDKWEDSSCLLETMSSDRVEFLQHLCRQHHVPGSANGAAPWRCMALSRCTRLRQEQLSTHRLRSIALQRQGALQRLRQEQLSTHRLPTSLRQEALRRLRLTTAVASAPACVPRALQAVKVTTPFGCTFRGPVTLREASQWAARFVAQASAADPESIADIARTMKWVMTSSFSGCGSAEIAAHSICEAIRKSSSTSLQPSLIVLRTGDKAPHTHAVLRQIVGRDTCILGDVMKWPMTMAGLDLQQRAAPQIRFHCHVHCNRHGRCTLLPTIDKRDGALHVEVAGPPCPPWSRMGRNRKTKDPRHCPHQIWVEYMRQWQPDVIIMEEVDTYDVGIIAENFPNKIWEVRCALLDPRVFGMSMARRRVYIIITLRRTTHWKTQEPLHMLLQKLSCLRIMTVDTYWDDHDAAALRPLSTGEKKRKKQYEQLPGTHRLAHAKVWDLAQSTVRPRGSTVDCALPCFTTHCASTFHREKSMLLSPFMLLRAMGHIADPHCAEAAGLPCLSDLGNHCSNAHMARMAGNAMHVPCVGACLFIVAWHVRRR